MKKTLAVAAVLAAFAGSAAADVTVYGIADVGLGWTHGDDGTNKVEMKSGMDSASRVGFIASEKIGDVTVGVKFESSFDATTGLDGDRQDMLGDKSKQSLFNRETRLFVKGAYGEVGMGRFGALDSTTGGHNLAGSRIHATTGINSIADTGAIFLGQNSRVENAIAYKSPVFGGFQAHAMYANEEGSEFSHEGLRYYGLGATYDVGALKTTFVASLEDGGDEGAVKGKETKAYTAAVSYDFGVTKALVAAQYFDNTFKTGYNYVDGFGVTAGAVTPLFGGSLKTQVGYMEAEDVANSAKEYDAYNVGALYYYNFSKRTQVYGGLGYTVKDDGATEVQTINGAIGLIHNF